jgi:hypothetical protein
MEIVSDTTDPQGALRPNLLPEPTTGTYFEALPHPEVTYLINLPSSLNPMYPIEIWDLFFSEEVMNTLVQNTNKSRLYWSNIGLRNRRAVVLQDITVTEIYSYFAILIYSRPGKPLHGTNCWKPKNAISWVATLGSLGYQ